jgi:hypothetical protein
MKQVRYLLNTLRIKFYQCVVVVRMLKGTHTYR